jgi:dienelactone hydrolase
MNELDLFRNFRRGVAPPSSEAKDRASARLATAVAGANMPSARRRRLRDSLAHASGRRLVLLAAGALVALVGTASAFSTVRDFILDREAQSVDYCIGAALRAKVIPFRATDGVQLHGVLLGSGQNGVVLAGGHHFRENLCDWLPFAQTLAQRGYRVLAYDSRPPLLVQRRLSRPAAAHLVRDVVAAERELIRRGVTRVLIGGAGPTGGTAAMTAAALIPRSVLAGVVVLTPVRQFAEMDAEAAARKITAPSFFGAGSRDFPFADEARKLYAASAAERKQLAVVPSSGEGTDLLLSSWAPPSFRAKLLAFVAAAFTRS